MRSRWLAGALLLLVMGAAKGSPADHECPWSVALARTNTNTILLRELDNELRGLSADEVRYRAYSTTPEKLFRDLLTRIALRGVAEISAPAVPEWDVVVGDADDLIGGALVPSRIYPAQIRLSHIFLRTGDVRTDAEAVSILKSARARLVNGETFESVAGELSESSSVNPTFSLGWLQRGWLEPRIDDQIWTMDADEISAPLQGQHGWHLFRVDGKRPARFQNVSAKPARKPQPSPDLEAARRAFKEANDQLNAWLAEKAMRGMPPVSESDILERWNALAHRPKRQAHYTVTLFSLSVADILAASNLQPMEALAQMDALRRPREGQTDVSRPIEEIGQWKHFDTIPALELAQILGGPAFTAVTSAVPNSKIDPLQDGETLLVAWLEAVDPVRELTLAEHRDTLRRQISKQMRSAALNQAAVTTLEQAKFLINESQLAACHNRLVDVLKRLQ